MPEWEESWTTAWVLYVAALFWGGLPELPKWGPPLLVTLAWAWGPVTHITDSIRNRTAALAVVSAVLQLGVTGLSALAFVGMVRLTAIHYLAAAALTAGAAIVVARCERKRAQPGPWYGFEGLVMTSFSAAYLVALASPSSVRPIPALIMLHMGILGVAVVRNSHIEVERTEGPVVENGYVKEVWRMRVREPRGIRAILAALTLPTGVIGSAVVLAEVALLVVLRYT